MLVVPHNSAMNLRQYICALALFVCAFAVHAHDFVTERTWVEDPTDTMTLAEVQQMPQTALYSPVFTQGFSQSAFWFRIRITPDPDVSAKPDDKLIIRIRPPFQDQIWLYDPLAPQDQVKTTGDYYDWMNDEYRSLNLNLVVPAGQHPRDIWLKLKTNQSTMTSIEVMSESEVRAMDRRQEMLTMLYLAVLVICFGWGVLAWINQRDSLVALYVCREFFAIIYALVILGYVRVFCSGWLSGEQLDTLTNVCVWLFVAVVIWFDTRLLAEFKPNRLLLQLLKLLMFALPLELAALILGKISSGILLNSMIVPPALFLAFLCALSTTAWAESAGAPPDKKPLISKYFLVFVYGVLLVVVLLNRLPSMGVISAQENSLYINLVYPMLTSLALMILVQTQLYRVAKRQQESQRRLELAEVEAIQERSQRVEQSNFLKMLAHEMKTPLSVVRMAVGTENPNPRVNEMADRAVQDMNNIIERLVEVEKLRDKQLSVQAERFDLVDIFHNIQAVQLAGDRLLVQMPQALIMKSDQQFVQIILSNLIENALKYGASDAPVHISIREQAARVFILVSNPIGSAGAPAAANVFDKYYRAPGAYERTGSGLGLYLTHALVGVLGGQIRYDECKGVVSFELWVPKKTL